MKLVQNRMHMPHNWKEASAFSIKNTENIAHYQMDPQSMSLIGQGRQKQEHIYLCQISHKQVGHGLTTQILDFHLLQRELLCNTAAPMNVQAESSPTYIPRLPDVSLLMPTHHAA